MSMKFCSEWFEVADNSCVNRNEIHHSVGERTQVLQDVAADPTLPRTKSVRCSNCGHGEAVFFQVYYTGIIYLHAPHLCNICCINLPCYNVKVAGWFYTTITMCFLSFTWYFKLVSGTTGLLFF
ncbi:hypothetical protein ACJIZ3_013550 [Penstemon smallii]|uniref:Uncharacterized protein n=1 Tax=Penstemon smallii TaxID=265156 RepID=A0ABD3RGX3_9LAMI